MHVGLIKDGHKYIIISRKTTEGKLYYHRMNDIFSVLDSTMTSKKILLQKVLYTEAFVFHNKKEMIDWLLK